MNDTNQNSNQESCDTLAYLKYADEGLSGVDKKESDKGMEQEDLEKGDFNNQEELFEKEDDDYEVEERSEEELPYPQFSKLSFNCFEQTSPIRLISIKMISNPYPFHN